MVDDYVFRESDIDWLTDVPTHWLIEKTAWHFRAEKGQDAQTLTKEYCGQNEGPYPVYSGQTENDGVMGRIDRFEFDVGEEGVLFSTTVGAKAMHLSHLFGRFSLSQNCLVIRPRTDAFFLRFAFYAFQVLFRFERLLIPDHMQASFRMDDFYQYRLMRPPLDEQKQIASFLYYETAKIDALIEKQQQLIALLGEKRQAVISHAVTKGLNPDAPMRDSGVEWLGEVPSHWTVKKLRYFAQILRGKFTHRPRNDPAFYDGDFPFIQTGEITGAGKFITKYEQTLNARGVSVSKQFPKGTLVMAIAANIGDVAILDFPAYFPDSIVGLVPNKTANVMFMYYMMQAMKQPMLRRATISTQMNLNVDQIAWLTAACPPLDEQVAIAEMLDQQLERMDELHERMEDQISLLQERRTALISAAVTGKIDVRGWKRPSAAPKKETEMEVA